MELVKSYDSETDDDSSIYENDVGPTPKRVKIDVAYFDDEFEDKASIEKDRNSEDKSNSITLTVSDADCIKLENSPKHTSYIDFDSDSFEKDSQIKRTSKVLSIQTPNSVKRNDYLNLEGSESDRECESSEKSISTLLDTASVLNETPYGPEKQINLKDITDITAKNVSHAKLIHETVKSNLCRNTPDSMQNCLSHSNAENSVLDTCDKKSTEVIPLGDNNISDSCIFRKDNHIIEASQHNVVCHIPKNINQTYNAHAKLITSLSWCIPNFSYLFLSASQDGSIKIWDLYRTNSVQCIKVHSALNAAEWSVDGSRIYAGGFAKKAFVYDVQTGKSVIQYDVCDIISSMECHPVIEDVFLVGTKNAVLAFDLRVDKLLPIRTFFSQCEEVLDIAFLDENEFVFSSNIVSHDSADRTIMAWDFGSGAKLSNQIFLERYTCPSLKVHPFNSTFIAQTNGNYIAAFSTKRPYKMKDKRYTGHKVSGYGIECDISPDGRYAVSGDVDGSLYFYNYFTTNVVFVTPKWKVPTNRVKWHPVLSRTLICSTYDGQIQIWK